MTGPGAFHYVPITLDGIIIKNRKGRFFQHKHVLCFFCRVTEHRLHAFSGAAIISLAVPPEGLKNVIVDIDRFVWK